MTVIVEYSDMVDTIQKLREFFPDLTGYLNFKDSGYCGSHLNLKIDGLTCEIQLAPRIVVMGVDYLHTFYEKWRDFNSIEELSILNKKKQEIINSNNSECVKERLLKLIEKDELTLQNKIKEEENDLQLRNKIYGEIFDVAGFSHYQDDIARAINELIENREESVSFTSPWLTNLLNENLLTDGKVDKIKVDKITGQFLKDTEFVQDKFVNLVKECLQL